MFLSTRARLLLSGFALLVGSVACEVLVGDTPSGSISCVPDSLGTCPAGQQCSGSGTCVQCPGGSCTIAILDAGHDSTVPHAETGARDTGVDHHVGSPDVGVEAARTGLLGDPCSGSTTCNSLLCATAADLPFLTNSVCSQPCCTAGDCASGFTCYASPGGNLCVSTELAKCQSGCPTPCCGPTSCGGSLACGFPDGGTTTPSCFPFGGNSSTCATTGDGTGGDGCDQSTDCQSGLCVSTGDPLGCGACTAQCCKDSDCSGGALCQWEELVDNESTPTSFARSCGTAAHGSAKTGESCTATMSWAGTECAGGVCAGGTCTGPCCTDEDCSGLTGGPWKCLPYSVTLTASAAVPLLVCQLSSAVR